MFLGFESMAELMLRVLGECFARIHSSVPPVSLGRWPFYTTDLYTSTHSVYLSTLCRTRSRKKRLPTLLLRVLITSAPWLYTWRQTLHDSGRWQMNPVLTNMIQCSRRITDDCMTRRTTDDCMTYTFTFSQLPMTAWRKNTFKFLQTHWRQHNGKIYRMFPQNYPQQLDDEKDYWWVHDKKYLRVFPILQWLRDINILPWTPWLCVWLWRVQSATHTLTGRPHYQGAGRLKLSHLFCSWPDNESGRPGHSDTRLHRIECHFCSFQLSLFTSIFTTQKTLLSRACRLPTMGWQWYTIMQNWLTFLLVSVSFWLQ